MKALRAILLAALTSALILSGCGKKQPLQEDYTLSNPNNPVATIEMNSGDKIIIELFPDKAPNTVNNFISLANSGFYDGVIFHRVIEGFMIQGGDPNGTGTGGPGYKIKGEFSNNSFPNDIKHVPGVLSMARQGNPYNPASAYDTAGSQFFIMTSTQTSLDGDYAAFGMVVAGMDTVEAIEAVDTDTNDKPKKEQKIKSIAVDTKGTDYPKPKTLAE